jgi:hypothetical protein
VSRGASSYGHEHQGVNPGARRLQRLQDAALAWDWVNQLGPPAPCKYPEHRRADWRMSPEHPWVCGVCHPPAHESLVGERAA